MADRQASAASTYAQATHEGVALKPIASYSTPEIEFRKVVKEPPNQALWGFRLLDAQGVPIAWTRAEVKYGTTSRGAGRKFSGGMRRMTDGDGRLLDDELSPLDEYWVYAAVPDRWLAGFSESVRKGDTDDEMPSVTLTEAGRLRIGTRSPDAFWSVALIYNGKWINGTFVTQEWTAEWYVPLGLAEFEYSDSRESERTSHSSESPYTYSSVRIEEWYQTVEVWLDLE